MVHGRLQVDMIITQQKPLQELLKYLKKAEKIFLIGCGECSTTCKTGGEEQVLGLKSALEKAGHFITGWAVPDAPCIAAQVRMIFAKKLKEIREADSIMVLSCGLGAQSVKENDRFAKPVHIACDTLFMGAINKEGAFREKCSACGECVLDMTGGICPITLCAKGILNGPCGGSNKGKCETDRDMDCAWALIYNELKKEDRLDLMRAFQPPKDHSKTNKPRRLTLAASLPA